MQEHNPLGNRLKRLLFLSPALFTAAVILTVYPARKPVLPQIPSLLEAEEPEERKTTDEPQEQPQGQEQVQPDPASESASEPGSASVPEPLFSYEDGVYEGVSRGYGGDVRVSVTVNGGQIVSIGLIEAEGETKAFLNRALPLLDTVTERQTWDVDAVSGATYSSRGILGAVQNALTGETVENEPPETEPEPEPISEHELEAEPETPEEPEASEAPEEPGPDPAVWVDGVYTGSAVCDDLENALYTVTATVTIRDGRIESISAERVDDLSDDPDLNEEYMDWALNGRKRGERFFAGIPDQITTSQSAGKEEIDAVSGATYSSHAIRQAVEAALENAR